MLRAAFSCNVMLNVVILNVIMLRVAFSCNVMLNVVIPNVVMLNVVAPESGPGSIESKDLESEPEPIFSKLITTFSLPLLYKGTLCLE
jgi:hypothetical protein